MVFRQPEGVIYKYTLRARFTLQGTSKNRNHAIAHSTKIRDTLFDSFGLIGSRN